MAESSVFEKAVAKALQQAAHGDEPWACPAHSEGQACCVDDAAIAKAVLVALATSSEVREAWVAAVENDDQTCHAGSPRNISDVYCYVPVPDAVDAIRHAIRPDES